MRRGQTHEEESCPARSLRLWSPRSSLRCGIVARRRRGGGGVAAESASRCPLQAQRPPEERGQADRHVFPVQGQDRRPGGHHLQGSPLRRQHRARDLGDHRPLQLLDPVGRQAQHFGRGHAAGGTMGGAQPGGPDFHDQTPRSCRRPTGLRHAVRAHLGHQVSVRATSACANIAAYARPGSAPIMATSISTTTVPGGRPFRAPSRASRSGRALFRFWSGCRRGERRPRR